MASAMMIKMVCPMKRFVYSLVAIVIAFATISSCNKVEEIEKEEVIEENDGLKTVNFTVTGKVEPKLTKTYIEESAGTYLAHWSDVSDEHLGVVFDAIDADMSSTTFDAFDITADVATFYGSATISLDDHTMHPFYPASAFNKTYGTGKIGLNLIREQHPVTGSFDPAADVMIGADQDITVTDADDILIEDVVLERPMAVLRLHLKAKNSSAKAYGESVTSVEMTVADGKKLTGAFSYTPGNSELTWNTSNNSVKAVFSAGTGNEDQVLIDTDADYNSVYLVINPETLAEGSSITFDIETDVHSGINKISRTVTVPAGGMTFLAGRVNEIDLTVRDKDVPDVIADTRILVEGFDNVTVSKTKAAANTTGVFGTGVSGSLAYTYSGDNTNVRITSSGQANDNPYLYFSQATDYFLIENIVVDNQTYLDFSAKVKNTATLTLQYKESSAGSWNTAGTYTGSGSFTDARFKFLISNTVTSLDLKLIASAGLLADDLVLQPGSAPEPLDMSKITVSSRTQNTINFTWDAVDGATGYMISTDGSTYGDAQVATTYSMTSLSSFTDYTIYVKAAGDGILHLDSTTPAYLTAKTTLAVPTSITWTKGTKTVSWTDTNTSAGTYGTDYKYQYTLNNGESFTDVVASGTSVTLDIDATKTIKLKAVYISDVTLNSAVSGGVTCDVGDTHYYTKVSSITSGEKYILVEQYGTKNYICSGLAASDKMPVVDASLLISDNRIASNSTTDAYAVTITLSEGKYSIVNSDDKYIYVSSGNVIAGASTTQYWTITEQTDKTWKFVNSNTNTRALFIGASGASCKNYATSNLGKSGYASTYMSLYQYE